MAGVCDQVSIRDIHLFGRGFLGVRVEDEVKLGKDSLADLGRFPSVCLPGSAGASLLGKAQSEEVESIGDIGTPPRPLRVDPTVFVDKGIPLRPVKGELGGGYLAF